MIFERPMTGPMVDVIWMLYGPETYWKLVRVLGLARAELQATLTEATLRLARRGRRRSRPASAAR